MSMFVYSGLACKLKDIIYVTGYEVKKNILVGIKHLSGDSWVFTSWNCKDKTDQCEKFNEIVKLLEEKGWGKE